MITYKEEEMKGRNCINEQGSIEVSDEKESNGTEKVIKGDTVVKMRAVKTK